MLDIIYVIGTLLFFALMLACVHGLAVLGHDAAVAEQEHK